MHHPPHFIVWGDVIYGMSPQHFDFTFKNRFIPTNINVRIDTCGPGVTVCACIRFACVIRSGSVKTQPETVGYTV